VTRPALTLKRDGLVFELVPGADRRRWVCRDCSNLPGACSRTGCAGRRPRGWRRQTGGITENTANEKGAA
jgi:hypothetical protein